MNEEIPSAAELHMMARQALRFGPISEHNPPGLQMMVAIAQVEQLERLNDNLEAIEKTLRHNMEVAVIHP